MKLEELKLALRIRILSSAGAYGQQNLLIKSGRLMPVSKAHALKFICLAPFGLEDAVAIDDIMKEFGFISDFEYCHDLVSSDGRYLIRLMNQNDFRMAVRWKYGVTIPLIELRDGENAKRIYIRYVRSLSSYKLDTTGFMNDLWAHTLEELIERAADRCRRYGYGMRVMLGMRWENKVTIK